MGEGVQPGAGGDRLGHADGQFGVADHHGGQHLGVEDDLLLMRLSELVSTEARPTSEPVPAVVGTATMGWIAVGVGAGPPVADILEIPDRARLPGHEGQRLGQIEPRAAAEGDHAVEAALAVGLQPGGEVGARWGSGRPRRRGAARARRLHQVERGAR
jgi:hypothetical protein